MIFCLYLEGVRIFKDTNLMDCAEKYIGGFRFYLFSGDSGYLNNYEGRMFRKRFNLKKGKKMDKYTKVILTIIALALSGIFIQNTITPAVAVGDGCGDSRWNPCYVEITDEVEVWGEVSVTNYWDFK